MPGGVVRAIHEFECFPVGRNRFLHERPWISRGFYSRGQVVKRTGEVALKLRPFLRSILARPHLGRREVSADRLAQKPFGLRSRRGARLSSERHAEMILRFRPTPRIPLTRPHLLDLPQAPDRFREQRRGFASLHLRGPGL